MSKIRINELARQLEVKSREVIDKLHELGITEALTHSSSIEDDNAEKLHGISKKILLKNGIAVDEVAARMNNALRNRELFSDSGFDEAWLQQIFDETALTPSFIVRRTSCEVIIRNRATQLGTSGKSLRKLQHEASQLSPIRHRAEADACYWATIWKLIGS